MSLSYAPLWVMLAGRNIKRIDLREKLNISSATIAKATKNDYVAFEILERICLHLDIPIDKAVSITKSDGERTEQPAEDEK